eukprot:5521452-Pyramimonas_sp.AAC.1
MRTQFCQLHVVGGSGLVWRMQNIDCNHIDIHTIVSQIFYQRTHKVNNISMWIRVRSAQWTCWEKRPGPVGAH